MFFKIIKQNKVGLLTTFGKYKKTLTPGINFYVPLVQQINLVSTETMDLKENINIRTKDDVLAKLGVGVIYNIKDPVTFFFKVEDSKSILSGLLNRDVRTLVPSYTLEKLMSAREELQSNIGEKMSESMDKYGIGIQEVFISDIHIGEKLSEAMEMVLTAKKHRDAAVDEAEANKVRLVKEAEANRDRMELQGEGIAKMRQRIAEGYEEAVSQMAKALQVSPKDAMTFILNSMLMDSYKDLATSKNAKTIFYPTSIRDSPFVWNENQKSVDPSSKNE